MDELILAKARYEDLLARMDADMATAEQYKKDMKARYKENMPLEAAMAIQSQVLRIQDYITQKFNNKVEILRAYDDLCKAIEEAE
jgi:hypothetical protein